MLTMLMPTIVFVFFLIAGFAWLLYAAWTAPSLCYFCGADTSDDEANDRERCSSCGTQFD